MNPVLGRMTRTATPGIATGHQVKLAKCMGVPVAYDARMVIISDSGGFLWWKKIAVGPGFLELTERQRGAVLLHEVGHCKLWHSERILLHTILRPRLLWAIIAASFAAARKFKTETPEALIWFQSEIERRAPGVGAYRQVLEAQADLYAKGCGYGPELAQVLLSPAGGGGPFHPSPTVRARMLLA